MAPHGQWRCGKRLVPLFFVRWSLLSYYPAGGHVNHGYQDLSELHLFQRNQRCCFAFSLVLIAGGVLFLLLPVFLIVLRNGYRLLNLIGVGRLRGSTDSNVPGDLQEEVGNRLVRDPSIRVVYPLEDGDWANGVVCPNAFAEGRLQILKRYFDSRRKRAAQAESSTEPFGTASNGSECSSAYDDDDLPVNECYGLRASGPSQAASCPNCRGSFRHEELVALYIIPRPTNQSPEDVPVEPNDHIEG
ncbi:hypothetical protein LSM04_000968 [Trypanosoma melophagium]|uniref:uncharacterized protein n=1 Tax=Trypanosoma melophagium TaxID=715481 RepID=UPI003519F412|nr:hypothetical protein LSM04_000968 [Trypanosoma melophagium]